MIWSVCLLLQQIGKLLIHQLQCLLDSLDCAAQQDSPGYSANNAVDGQTASCFVEVTCILRRTKVTLLT